LIQTNSERLGFDDVSIAALKRTVTLNTDPVEKLASRLALARFFQAHQDPAHAEVEFTALLAENPNLLGIVRANTDFYWSENNQREPLPRLRRLLAGTATVSKSIHSEAAQKGSDSADFETARRLLDTLLAAEPSNGDLLAAKALTYAREGDNKGLVDSTVRTCSA